MPVYKMNSIYKIDLKIPIKKNYLEVAHVLFV